MVVLGMLLEGEFNRDDGEELGEFQGLFEDECGALGREAGEALLEFGSEEDSPDFVKKLLADGQSQLSGGEGGDGGVLSAAWGEGGPLEHDHGIVDGQRGLGRHGGQGRVSILFSASDLVQEAATEVKEFGLAHAAACEVGLDGGQEFFEGGTGDGLLDDLGGVGIEGLPAGAGALLEFVSHLLRYGNPHVHDLSP